MEQILFSSEIVSLNRKIFPAFLGKLQTLSIKPSLFLIVRVLPAIPFAPNPSGHHPARRPFPNTSFGSCPSGVPRKPTIRADQLACAFVRCRRGGTQSDLLQSPETNDAQATADASGSPSRPGHPVCTADQSFRRPPLNPTTLRHQQLPPSPASTPSQETEHASQQGENSFFNMLLPLFATPRSPQIS